MNITEGVTEHRLQSPNSSTNSLEPIYDKIAKLKQNLNVYAQNEETALKDTNQSGINNKALFSMSYMEGFPHQIKRVSQIDINRQTLVNRDQQILNRRRKVNSKVNQNYQKITVKEKVSSVTSQNGIFFSAVVNNKEAQTFIKIKPKSCLRSSSFKEISTRSKSQMGSFHLQKQNDKSKARARSVQKTIKIVNFLDRYQNKNPLLSKKSLTESKDLAYEENEENEEKILLKSRNINLHDLNKQQFDGQIQVQNEGEFANQQTFEALKLQKLKLQNNSPENSRSNYDSQSAFKPLGSAKRQNNRNSSQQSKSSYAQKSLSRQKSQRTESGNKQSSSNIFHRSSASKIKPNQTRNISNPLANRAELSSPSKYLRKGSRMREVLEKKLASYGNSADTEMVYVREYDQWVPAELLASNRNQLEVLMSMLLGEKKQRKRNIINLEQNNLFYL